MERQPLDRRHPSGRQRQLRRHVVPIDLHGCWRPGFRRARREKLRSSPGVNETLSALIPASAVFPSLPRPFAAHSRRLWQAPGSSSARSCPALVQGHLELFDHAAVRTLRQSRRLLTVTSECRPGGRAEGPVNSEAVSLLELLDRTLRDRPEDTVDLLVGERPPDEKVLGPFHSGPCRSFGDGGRGGPVRLRSSVPKA